MAISDTITSMYDNTSNAYDMLSNGTDLTGINKNLENLSSTIFEAFLEALRNPDTLFNNLPKTSGSGSNITLNNTAYAPMRITLGSSALVQRNLPSEYTQVDYIVCNDNTYISLGFKGNQNHKFEMKIRPSTLNNITPLFGNITDNTKGMSFNISSSDYSISRWGNDSYTGSPALTTGTDYIATASKDGYYIDSTLFWQPTANTFETQENINLFATSGTSTYKYRGRAYYVKIYESGTLIRDFLPCYKNSDNKVGMYDMVQGKFYSSAGTDEFTYGAVATPTPSSPQDIHTISGNNTIVVEGKNICYKTELQNANNIRFYFNNKALEKTITISVTPNVALSNNSLYLVEGTTSYGVTGTMTTSANVRGSSTITLSDTIYNSIKNTNNACYFLLYKSNAGFTLPTDTQIENGNVLTDYTPYVSQTNPINLGDIEYCKIGDYEDKFVRSGGEQLFDKDNANVLNSYINEVNATIISSGKSKTIYISCNQNTTYTISKTLASARFVVGTTTNTPTDNVVCNQVIANNTATSITITTGANDNYLCAFIYHSDNDSPLTLEQVLNRIMINKGTTALPYTPYEKGWYIKKNIGKYVANNDLTINGSVNNYVPMLTPILNITPSLSASDLSLVSMNNMFQIYDGANTNYSGQSGTTGTGKIRINIGVSYATTEATANTFLTNNNFTIYYVMATPTYTKITGELAQELEQVYKGMLSYDGTTNISQVNNDLPFELVGSAITK